MITIDQATVGTEIRSNVDFCGVPKGTFGIIDEDYGTGVMVAWDLPEMPLPDCYRVYDGVPAVRSKIMRDGFGKEDELKFLDFA